MSSTEVVAVSVAVKNAPSGKPAGRLRCSGVVVRGRVELPTFRFSGGRSYRLSYLTKAVLTGLEPATSTLTGWRALRLLYRTLLATRGSPPAPPVRAYHRLGGAWRGDLGTVLAASARSTGTVTSSPEVFLIPNDSESAVSSMPRMSAISSPAPVAAGRRQRTTTRLPTSSGVSRTSRRKYTRKRVPGPLVADLAAASDRRRGGGRSAQHGELAGEGNVSAKSRGWRSRVIRGTQGCRDASFSCSHSLPVLLPAVRDVHA
jgi:hypothetical protein